MYYTSQGIFNEIHRGDQDQDLKNIQFILTYVKISPELIPLGNATKDWKGRRIIWAKE